MKYRIVRTIEDKYIVQGLVKRSRKRLLFRKPEFEEWWSRLNHGGNPMGMGGYIYPPHDLFNTKEDAKNG